MKKENLLYALGLLLILASAMLFTYNMWLDHQAGVASDSALQEILPMIEPEIESRKAMVPEMTTPMDLPEYALNPNIPMPIKTIRGFDYIGVLSLPTLELEFPILDKWDYRRLNISPCTFTGSIYLKNMVICGHNYPKHFGRLKNLSYGDAVEFTDMAGNVFSYTVTEIEILPGSQSEKMTAGEYPLTLFTCDRSNRSNRVTVRCSLSQKQFSDTP